MAAGNARFAGFPPGLHTASHFSQSGPPLLKPVVDRLQVRIRLGHSRQPVAESVRRSGGRTPGEAGIFGFQDSSKRLSFGLPLRNFTLIEDELREPDMVNVRLFVRLLTHGVHQETRVFPRLP